MDALKAPINQTNLFGTDLLVQLDRGDPLLQLAAEIPWQDFEQAFAIYYSEGIGAPKIVWCRKFVLSPPYAIN